MCRNWQIKAGSDFISTPSVGCRFNYSLGRLIWGNRTIKDHSKESYNKDSCHVSQAGDDDDDGDVDDAGKPTTYFYLQQE